MSLVFTNLGLARPSYLVYDRWTCHSEFGVDPSNEWGWTLRKRGIVGSNEYRLNPTDAHNSNERET